MKTKTSFLIHGVTYWSDFMVAKVKKFDPAGPLLICICLIVTACSGGLVRGQPPMVGLSTINSQPQALNARVAIFNPNGIDMPVASIEMSMTLGDNDLGTHTEQTGITIHPNGTEEIGFSFPADETARNTLADLENKVVNSVPYTVTGRVIASDGSNERFSQEGYLYPIPGRPGEFRGAGPQSERPQ